MAKGDLHVHTTVSDGLCSPSALAGMAAAAELDFLSVADHNSLDALGPVEQGLAADGTVFISGVELSAQPPDGREVHVLGYNVGRESTPLLDMCSELRRLKSDQLREITRRMADEGVNVDYGVLCLDEDGTYPGRPLLADLLVQAGIVESVNQAFGRYLGERAPTFVPMACVAPEECIAVIHSAGGLAVLAHPTIETVDRWIAPLAAAGLDGVETYRPALSGNAQLYVEKAAEHFDLFVTGGSDWHGREGGPPLGYFFVTDHQVRDFLRALGPAAGGLGG